MTEIALTDAEIALIRQQVTEAIPEVQSLAICHTRHRGEWTVYGWVGKKVVRFIPKPKPRKAVKP